MAGGLGCLVYLLHQVVTKKLPIRAFTSGFVLNTKYALVAVLLLIIAALLPLPKPALIGPEIFTGRATTSDAAASSRTEQLGPLLTQIKKSPWIGSGFGTTVTYKSFDPRALELNPSGTVTTAAFEWGYLDTITEIGILGLLIFIAFVISIILSLIRAFKASHDYIYLGLTLGIISIAVVSIFSPYWNHPLGLGFLMLAWGIGRAEELEN